MLHFESGNRGLRLPITETMADTYHGVRAGSGQVSSAFDRLEANFIGLTALTLVLAVVAGLGWAAVLVAPITGLAAIAGHWLLVD